MVVKKLVILAGLGLLAASLSGCFFMRTLSYTKDKVDAGKKTTALISVLAGTGTSDEYPFFFMASEGGSKLVKGGKLDTKSVYDGPVSLKPNAALIPFAEDNCNGIPKAKGPGTTTESLVATNAPFVAPNENKLMDAKVPIKASKHSPGGDAYALYMATWTDDGDGVPEDPGTTDDGYDCQPPYTSAILIHGGTPPGP